MLFQNRFHAGIQGGSTTLTFRTWKTARALAGKRYRFGQGHAVEVDAIDEVMVGDITEAQAKRSGFPDREALVQVLRKTAPGRLTARSRVFRVRFHYVAAGDPRLERREDTTPEALDEVAARLARMDKLSRRGPWTRAVLRLIQRKPQVAASKLAPELKRERRAFKADVRKLKELGLTISHDVGYSLSPRGRALLARSPR